MSELPKCPKCSSVFTYADGALLICPECAHEWAAASLDARAESSKDDWFDEECVPKSIQRWCVSKHKQGGWTLKYKTESPADLVDVGWLVEVWVKGRDALVCELKTGRGVPRSNGC